MILKRLLFQIRLRYLCSRRYDGAPIYLCKGLGISLLDPGAGKALFSISHPVFDYPKMVDLVLFQLLFLLYYSRYYFLPIVVIVIYL